jgi:hypothetical protein
MDELDKEYGNQSKINKKSFGNQLEIKKESNDSENLEIKDNHKMALLLSSIINQNRSYYK